MDIICRYMAKNSFKMADIIIILLKFLICNLSSPIQNWQYIRRRMESDLWFNQNNLIMSL